jgi:endoglucanase
MSRPSKVRRAKSGISRPDDWALSKTCRAQAEVDNSVLLNLSTLPRISLLLYCREQAGKRERVELARNEVTEMTLPLRNLVQFRLVLMICLLAIAFDASMGYPRAQVPPDRITALKRGINITHWFRYPVRQDDNYYQTYMSDATLRTLHGVGFTFIRLPVQPELLLDDGGRINARRVSLLLNQIKRVQHQGLAVMMDLQVQDWDLEHNEVNRGRLVALWRSLGVALRGLDPRLTFPEIINEPVFPETAAWEALQERALRAIRESLPDDTIVLSGTHWSDIDGLLQGQPPADRQIVYAVHFYEPYVLAVGDPAEPDVKREELGRMPFPAADTKSCEATAEGAADHAAALIRWYCSEHWDATKIHDRIGQAAGWASRYHVSLVFNEFGISPGENKPARLAWLEATRKVLEQNGFGWAIWGYDDSMGFNFDTSAARQNPAIDPALLRALGLKAAS